MATLQECRRALELNQERLITLANVEGLGVRELSSKTQNSQSRMCLAVYVSQKVPSDQLAPPDIIPRYVTLADSKNVSVKIPIGVFEIGQLTVQ